MPPLIPPPHRRSIVLPPREATLAAETDVLVVGGGPAGIGAALGAAEAGARVILVERYGFLGGNATAALVMPLMSFHTQRSHPARDPAADNLMPSDHGPGDPVIAGALQRFLERLIAAKGAIAPSRKTGFTVPFDAELMKAVALDLLDEAGVSFLLHSFASGVLGKDRVEGVIFETKSGPMVIRARAVVDCTGDGDIAALAGAPYEVGREDGLVQPMTLMFRMADFDRAGFEGYTREHPDQWRGVHGLWALVEEARKAGELELPREDILFFGTPHENEVALNCTRVGHVVGTSVWDLTRAEHETRRQLRSIAAFLQERVPGFEKSYVVQSGVHAGVRETRRVLGEYQLSADDVLNARRFDDAIARSTYPIDIHNPDGKSGTVLRRLPPGEAYDIPLRALVPQRAEGLLVAGRCISGTHEAHSSYRVMPVCMATGQAAGVCAALSAKEGRLPRDVDAPQVQEELERQGASLERERLRAAS